MEVIYKTKFKEFVFFAFISILIIIPLSLFLLYGKDYLLGFLCSFLLIYFEIESTYLSLYLFNSTLIINRPFSFYRKKVNLNVNKIDKIVYEFSGKSNLSDKLIVYFKDKEEKPKSFRIMNNYNETNQFFKAIENLGIDVERS